MSGLMWFFVVAATLLVYAIFVLIGYACYTAIKLFEVKFYLDRSLSAAGEEISFARALAVVEKDKAQQLKKEYEEQDLDRLTWL